MKNELFKRKRIKELFCCLLWFIPVALLLTISVEFMGRYDTHTMVVSSILHPAHFLPGVGVGVEAENLVRDITPIITTCNTIQMTKCRISFNEDAAHLS